MKKIIFTSLLLAATLCKAADDRYIGLVNTEAWNVAHDVSQHITQCLDYYRKIYTARLLGSDLLDLSGYEIEAISDNLPNLVSLYLRNNRIENIPANLNLGLLQLNNNLTAAIPDNLNLPNLVWLYLSNNEIQTIDPKVLNQFPHLEYLHLEENYLREENINQLQEYAAGRDNLTIFFGEQKKGRNIKPAKRQ